MKPKTKYVASDGIQFFMCPFETIYITQGAGGELSHKGTKANDIRGVKPGERYAYYAPCDVECLWVYKDSGQALWRSKNKVIFANGNIDYATFMTVHDDSFNAYVGQVIPQGSQLGNMGTKGYATGVHCHIEIAQHKYSISDWKKNQYGIWCFPDETDIDDCCFINDTEILGGVVQMDWKTIPQEYIKYEAHVEGIGWQGWKADGQLAGTTNEAKRLEALKIDCKEDVYAKAHIQSIGWVDYGKVNKNTVIGTIGEQKRLECLCLKGNFKYRLHIQNTGWTCWTNADGVCTLGSVGQALRIEAIEIMKI